MGDERRTHERLVSEIKVDYRTIGSFITDYSTNLSKGGVFVATSLPMKVDDKVRLRLSLPDHELPFALDGIVRWARTAAEDPDNPGMGVEFINFEDVREQIEAFVETLDEKAE